MTLFGLILLALILLGAASMIDTFLREPR